MKHRCVALGRPNAGKTVFTLNFAAFLGARQLSIAFAETDGRRVQKNWKVNEAVRELVGPTPHLTRRLQSVELDIARGKASKTVELVDTSGLVDGIHPSSDVRRAMAQTLAAVRDASVILHVMDADLVGRSGPLTALGEVDYQVAQFAQIRGGYGILANKMDLPAAARGLQAIRKEFPGHAVFPISAIHRRGFREVHRFVWRQL